MAGKSAGLIKYKFFKIFLPVMLIWLVASNLWIWPDYLSYFNEFIGGPKNGYKYLRDSNIDWGQDLPALAKYMRDNNIDSIKLHYFGVADPASYGIKYTKLNQYDYKLPKDDIYAISAHLVDDVDWTQYYKPVSRMGYSIFLYDFRK